MSAAIKTKDLYEGIKKAKGADYADALFAKLDVKQWKNKAAETGKKTKDYVVALRKEYKNKVASVLVVAPLGAAIGALAGDWLHDKVVEKLGADNFATPYVVPLAGIVIAAIGFGIKDKDLDIRAGVTGLGFGMAVQGARRSYADFWSK